MRSWSWEELTESGWKFNPGCDCNFCALWEREMATGGKPVENIAGPEEVTTKTKVLGHFVPTWDGEIEETLEQRNERIWQAIRNAAGG